LSAKIQSKFNQYRGVNPHLNSQAQNSGADWKDFHHGVIEYTRQALNEGFAREGLHYKARLKSGLDVRMLIPILGNLVDGDFLNLMFRSGTSKQILLQMDLCTSIPGRQTLRFHLLKLWI
jgi:hypothetical protein